MTERPEPARAVVERSVVPRGRGFAELEWLVANGLGGYASSTLAMTPTRRYHGLLVAALPGPVGRVVMLAGLEEEVERGGTTARTDGVPAGDATFTLRDGLPEWSLPAAGGTLHRRVLLPHRQNTVHVAYRLDGGGPAVTLRLRPLLALRRLEDPVSATPPPPPARLEGGRCEVTAAGLPALHVWLPGGTLTAAGAGPRQHHYALEAARGYDADGTLWSPGTVEVPLAPGEEVVLAASVEPWPACRVPDPVTAVAAERHRRATLLDRAAPGLREGAAAELVLAADQFLVTPAGRTEDEARAHAEGDEVRTVVAGYHWFTDWGRDTMISLEGLTLVTGRAREAGAILRNFARHVRRGLIPNLFPEGDSAGLYHTADATLWFVHAIHRYHRSTGDRRTLAELLPVLREILDAHLAGTDFGIGVDPADGLLRQGAPGYQLTWMDAKVGGWVVTPRRGKAVELQGLWYNALRLMQGWFAAAGDAETAARCERHAEQAHRSFAARFWNPAAEMLFDVVDGEDGDDPACRPNQLLAFSLEHPILDGPHRRAVLDAVTERLLTPAGLRSLAPGEPGYRARYDGDLRSRDAAYHQGTVWAWLIGPYADCWRRVHGTPPPRSHLDGLLAELGTACIGQLSEIFDAEAPFAPRGCVAQAWSVAETLRCLAAATGDGAVA